MYQSSANIYQVDGVKAVEQALFLGEENHVRASVGQLGKSETFSRAGKFVGIESFIAGTNPGAMVRVSDTLWTFFAKQ